MTSNFRDVGEFHEKFELDVVHEDCYENCQHKPRPRDEWNGELIEFRARFLREELDEFNEGVRERDHAKMADALIDLVYVAMGTAHLLGYPWEELWDEVQRANMSKVRASPDGSNSKRRSRWDVVKPLGWTPPEIDAVLWCHGFDTK